MYSINNQPSQATEPADIVTELWQSSRFGETTKEAYRQGFAQRQLEYDGSELRTDSDENFVADLLRIGVMKVLS